MPHMPIAFGIFLFALSATAAAHGDADATGGVPPEQLGSVNFPVSCNDAAQKEFNRAMALFHSFWFEPAKQSFARVLEHDPDCGMAHWGIAFMSLGNPYAWPANPKAMAAGAAAMEDALRAGAGTTREQGYIAALARLFEDWDSTEHRPRALAFEQAMGELAHRYPEDIEARILHALLLGVTALPADKSFTRQLQAAAILEPLFRTYPEHPGVAHYLIHSYDHAELAEKALPAARIYADIAPSVPHALHMPSHIFTRVGLWQEVVDGNRASYLAARAELQETTLDVGTYDALHAMDYMVFGHLQLAQDGAAQRLVDEVSAIRKVNVENFVAAYAFAAIPARYALERGDWAAAAALQLSPAGLAWERFPQAESVLVFARGLGAARSGKATAAQEDLERLQTLEQALRAAGADYWAAQTAYQAQALHGWIALADGDADAALQRMRAAADAEDATDKHPVTPGNIAPTRELLGEMLMELGRPAEALVEFERSLERDPNRFRGIHGAAAAALGAGRADEARRYYERLMRLAADRDTERPEIRQAEAHLDGYSG